MNFVGKFDATLPVDDPGAHSNAQPHVDIVKASHVPPDAIIVPDAHLLFTGDFKRAGVDLILSRDDHELVLHDYFRGEKRATLASPDGAHLTGDLVNALTGHVEYAQADGSAGAGKIIGHVTKLAGSATAVRNGVSIILNQGDNVEKGDVIQSGSGSTVGITFIDGTVFGLSSNARMVLNEMVYDPNGSNNSSLISLVAGTISFVAGETAKHGDMKVDTPVATMGIRGTAVLVEIDFDIPGQGTTPDAKFQVLVEPDGHTGSYILYDKTTLAPIATVNQAGQQINISQGVVSQTVSGLSADVQKLITDVFAQKFTDNTNPKTFDHFTDTPIPQSLAPIKLASGAIATPVILLVAPPSNTSSSTSNGPTNSIQHISQAPAAVAFGDAAAERVNATHSSAIDTASGVIRFADINAGDLPTVKTTFNSFTYQDAHHTDVTGTLTAQQIADITAVEANLSVVPDPGNNNTGSATWTYSVADSAFDFIAAGETLTLTYVAEVDSNYAPNNLQTFKTFTITITGTNDAPTIATAGSAIVERVGTGLTAVDKASGTVTFTDVDLTDRPVVSASFASFKYLDSQNHDVTSTLSAAQLAAVEAVETGLVVTQAAGNTNNGSATWTYSLPDKSFDFLAQGETLILNYVAEVDDGHGGIVRTPITVSINGADVTVVGTNDLPVITSVPPIVLINEIAGTTNSATPDAASGAITFTDVDLSDIHTVTVTGVTTSGVTTGLPSSSTALLDWISLGAVADSTNGVTGSDVWTFSAADKSFDYLAAGETVTLTYTLQVADDHGGAATQNVTIIVTGTNDAPMVAADTSGTAGTSLHAITERVNKTGDYIDRDTASGTLTFTDVDLTDTHTVSKGAPSYVWSGGTLTWAQTSALNAAGVLTLTEHDSTGTGSGSVGFSYSAADSSFDFLAAGQTLTITYDVTVTDNNHVASTQPVTFTITGTNDAPVLYADLFGLHVIAERAGKTGDSTDHDTASGTLIFTDADLTDTHTVSEGAPSYIWYGGTLTTAQINALNAAGTLALTEHDSTGTGFGSIGFSYSAADSSFDFLAAGQTLTITYDVTVTDNSLVASTRPVTFTIIGTNDAPVLNADASGPHVITEMAGKTGDHIDHDTVSGTLTFTDADLTDTHTVSKGTPSYVWSGGNLTWAQTSALNAAGMLMLTEHDSTGTGFGSIGFSYSAADSSFDFLAAGQTLTITYDVTVTDSSHVASTRPVTFTIIGTNDAPVLNADASGPHVITEMAGKTGDHIDHDTVSGTLTFTDADLTDTHTVSKGTPNYVWSGGTLTWAQTNALNAAGMLMLTEHDSTGMGSGSIGFNYSAADSSFDFLAAGQTLTITYDVTVADNNHVASTQAVTITIDGADDAPVLNADASGHHAITELTGKTGDSTDHDTASGTLIFTDVDLSDTHAVSEGAPSYVWSGGTLTTAQIDALNAAGTLALTEHDSTGTGSGSVGFSYNAVDSSFDFLAAGQTLTITYNVTVTDNSLVASTRPVTFTITGTNDAPVLNASGPHVITEMAGKTGDHLDHDTVSGTLTFTDADLSDTHTVSEGTPSYVWSGGTLTAAQINALTAAGKLVLSETDSTHSGAGSVGFSYSAADSSFDFLAAGQTLTVTYDVTVTDNHQAASTQAVTITIDGADDAPSIVSETNPSTETVILARSPTVLAAGVATNSLGLHTETFDGFSAGSASNNGFGHGNFTSRTLDATFTASGDAGVVHGSSSVSAPPFEGPSPGHQDTTNYLSIGAHGTETITFATEQNEFGLYWGSVDSFNTINFYDGSHLVASYTGADVAPLLANGTQGSFSSNGYVEFSDLAPFTKVVLGTGDSNAFELDNVSAGFVSDSHIHLASPVAGTLTVSDADIGDTLTASVIGDAVVEYNGSTTLPSDVNVAALIDPNAVTFDSVKTTGGPDVLDWTYNPTNADLDFLEPGDTLTVTFKAQVSDGHVTIGDQPLTVTLVGTNASVVNGTSQNDTFVNVGGGTTIFGRGGQDTFVFNKDFGSATIADFDVNKDAIEVDHSLFASVSALLASAQPANFGHDTIITDAAHDKMTLLGVTVAQIQAHPNDFHLI